MSKPEWDKRIARAGQLASEYPFAAEVLNFYGRVAAFQKLVYDQAASCCVRSVGERISLREQLDVRSALQHLPALFSLVEKHGPPGLMRAGHALSQEGQDQQLYILAVYARGDGPRGELAHFFARACLQPYAEYNASHSNLDLTAYTGPLCPLCNSRPQVAVLRPEGNGAKRSLICSFCLLEWNFRRIVCPACGEQDKEKLPRFSSLDFSHLRVEACDTCMTYLKSVDLTVNGLAIPIVDEIAGAPLDLWAGDHGYSKIELNLVGC